ncbi:DUF4135 domain-containing protein, partial [Treponema pedis]|uniref:DUF4135 domain-containing protein n=1 Tax=Treponema pedis TaxID=409322 RepID=UPI000493F524
ISLLIFRKKKLNAVNIYDNYFSAPYTNLLKDLKKTPLINLITFNITSLLKTTKNSIYNAITNLVKLGFISNENDIEEIRLELGDLHFDNIMSILVITKSDKKFFLKSTPCEPADCFYKICDELNIDYVRKDLLAITKNYTISNFLAYEPIVANIENFYNRIGMLMAVATVLNLTDIHLENLLVSSNSPVILDFESLFTFRNTVSTINFDLSDKAITDIELTLFVEEFNEKKAERSFISALQGGEVRNKSYLYPFVLNDGTDNFIVKYRKLSNYKSHNRICNNKGIVKPEQYISIIEKAFKKTMEKVIKNKEKIKNILTKSYVNQFKYRYIIRPTGFYHFIYVRSWQPTELENPDAYWNVIAKKLENEQIKNFDKDIKKQIIKSEIMALKQGLIPFFYRDGTSNNLFDFQNTVIKNTFLSSIFTCIQTKIDKIDDKYIHENLRALKNCLNSSKTINQKKLNQGWLQ